MMVTGLNAFQSSAVKVRLSGLTVPSPVSVLVTVIVTLSVGWLRRRTPKVAVFSLPDSAVSLETAET